MAPVERNEHKEQEELGYGHSLVSSLPWDCVENLLRWPPQHMGHVALEVSSSTEMNCLPLGCLLSIKKSGVFSSSPQLQRTCIDGD